MDDTKSVLRSFIENHLVSTCKKVVDEYEVCRNCEMYVDDPKRSDEIGICLGLYDPYEGCYYTVKEDSKCSAPNADWKIRNTTLEQRYEQLERILKDMWHWVRKTAYAEQGYLTISELKEYARQFKECGVILGD